MGREPKRRWALLHVNSVNAHVPWIVFTARGPDKAAKKLCRILDRRPGIALLIDTHPDHFSLGLTA